MAPPRKHDTDAILDAARTLALRDGPRATSVAAIARESGAPAGTLYHRFGSRDGVLREAWLRALGRFQAGALAAAGEPDAVEAGVAMAISAITFARTHTDDARLLLAVRPADLLDDAASTELAERLAVMNAPLEGELRRVARALHGRADGRALDAVARAVVDLPHAAVRRHARAGTRLPGWLEEDIADAARRLLTAAP